MTYNDFIFICGEHGVCPLIASEDANVKKIVRSKGNTITKQIILSTYLKENF